VLLLFLNGVRMYVCVHVCTFVYAHARVRVRMCCVCMRVFNPVNASTYKGLYLKMYKGLYLNMYPTVPCK